MAFHHCFARQQPEKGVLAGALLSARTLKDGAMSSLVYRGVTAGVMFRFLAAYPHVTHDVAAWGATGRLHDKDQQSALRENEFGAAYQCLLRCGKANRLRFSVGGEWSSFLQLREHLDYNNNPAYYVFNTALGPVVKGSYGFSGRWELSTSLFCPAASLLSVSHGRDNKENDFYSPTGRSVLKNVQPAFRNRYAGLGMTTTLRLPVGKTNRLYAAWKWQYYRISEIADLQSASNNITVNYYFSL
jgi:hypothetical protein